MGSLALAASSNQAVRTSILSERHVFLVALGLGILTAVLVLLPLFLAWSYRPKGDVVGRKKVFSSFFEIPFITWFIVHYGIAAIAIFAIVLLGIDDVIDKGTVSALLGSLFGYVLGSSAHSSSTRPQPGGGSEPQVRPGGAGGESDPQQPVGDDVF
jgi:hypothetical protein